MNYVVPPREVISAPVAGSADRFPIRRIYCLGKNYAAHAREMGTDDRDPPCFFTKDADAYAPDGANLPYPPFTQDYHHEIELVVAIGKEGFEIDAGCALQHVFGYAIGLDMTRRDLQAAAKKAGLPWSLSKNFPQSAPLGAIHPISTTGEINRGEIRLSVNGAIRQQANLYEMTWSVNETIAHLSKAYRLAPGDLIYTGTPEGVGPVSPGDELEGCIEGLGRLRVSIV